MYKNLSIIMFYTMLISGTMISISSNSWLGAWMGLEMNLLAFIPIINNFKNMMFTEASLKYFLVQAMASSILLFSILFLFFYKNLNLSSFYNLNISLILMNSALMMKLGIAPFHFWFPSMIEGLSWMNCLILLIWQKIAPMMLIMYIINIKFMIIIIIITTLIGAIGGLNQISLRKILAFSSINHMGWMLSSMMISNFYWKMYFLIYSIITFSIIINFYSFNIFYLNQSFLIMNNYPENKFLLYCNLLSLGGLPPFLGFLPKWLIIQNLLDKNMLIIIFMMMMTLITLFYYIRITYSAFLLNYNQLKFSNFMIHNKFLLYMSNFLTLMGMMSLFLFFEL
uniref:NADH-ubiquinone oxidoreductase chain 2 n=1 Tax=Climacia areolaris TaxID=560896 RepID=A0A1S5QYQ1_9NEOP|nr:NADH dehydrogenase subunit 2 [Climacia areolaris]